MFVFNGASLISVKCISLPLLCTSLYSQFVTWEHNWEVIMFPSQNKFKDIGTILYVKSALEIVEQ
jgi:hypothetical protein